MIFLDRKSENSNNMTIKRNELFAPLPDSLRQELLSVFDNICYNYREGRWEPSELNGGKYCEVVYTILKGYLNGTYPENAIKPNNMLQACQALEQYPTTTAPRSIRIQIPRMLTALYEVRNNRGVGHVGGDVNPNHMDATCVMYMCRWIYAELIRVFHNISISEAESVIELLTERILPMIWVVNGNYRVLDTNLTMKEKSLIILYSQVEPIIEDDLFSWVEHSNATVYRRDILKPLHKEKYLEYDQSRKLVTISPNGITRAEEILRNSGWSLGV